MNTLFYTAPDRTGILARFAVPLAITLSALFVGLSCAQAQSREPSASAASRQAEDALMPFLDVLTNPPAGQARCFRVQGRLESIGTQIFDPESAAFEFALQPPAKLRVSVPFQGASVTLCRTGQGGWAAPATLLRPLLAQLPSSKTKKEFPPMELPFSGKQLSMLPALLEVLDKGTTPLGDTSCRVWDVRVRPDIARLLPPEAGAWALRLWLNPAGRPVRAGFQGPDKSAVFRLEHLQFAPQLAPETWTPASDSVQLSPADFDCLATLLLEPKLRKSKPN